MQPLPSEQRIRDHLVENFKAAPAKLQKIGEVFLAVRDPERYQMLRPQGRNSWLQTKKGYPDAYVKDADGVHIVEATVGDWRKHIENEDAKRIPQLGRVGSYVLFSLEPAESLIPQSNASEDKKDKNEDHYKDLLAGLGVPRDQIEFVFLDQLVSSLRTPRYGWVLRDIGLVSDLLPFENLDTVSSANPGGPTSEEYADEAVICNERLDRMFDIIRDARLFVITGLGGVGKTTAGLALAYRWLNRNPAGAYYLDAKWLSGVMGGSLREALSAIEYYKNTETLFVIDNVHLLQYDEIARIVQCAQASPITSVMLLGRDFPRDVIANLPVALQREVHIEPLSVTRRDLLAAYRLHARHVVLHKNIPEPTEVQLAEWHRLAPDLVLFSASLRGAKLKLMSGLIPAVSREEAINYVRARYIADLPPDERKSLITIAKLAELEIPASLRSLHGVGPKWLLGNGLIAQSTSTGSHAQRFSLPHDNFGALILECFDATTVATAWMEALRHDVFQASYIAKRLIDLDEKDQAREILTTYESRIWSFSDLFPPSFAHTLDTLYERLGLKQGYSEKILLLYESFVAGSENFLAGARSYVNFAERHGYHAEQFHRVLLNQSIERLEVALRLASPVDFAYFVKLFNVERDAFDERYSALLVRPEILCAFLNKFQGATLSEINHALGLIHANDRMVYEELRKLVGTSVPLASLFEYAISGNGDEFRDFLQHQHVLELLATGSFLSLCAQRLAKGFGKTGWLIDRSFDAGPNTQALISAALEAALGLGPIRGSGRPSADILYYVVRGARAEPIIDRYISLLSPDDLTKLVLHWPLARLELAWRTMQAVLAGTAVFTKVRSAMLAAVWIKLTDNVNSGSYAAVAIARYAWMFLGGDPARLHLKIDPELRKNLGLLSTRLVAMKKKNAGNHPATIALAATIAELEADQAV